MTVCWKMRVICVFSGSLCVMFSQRTSADADIFIGHHYRDYRTLFPNRQNV